MRPPLVVFDDHARLARRYFPKPNGGFMVDEIQLCKAEDQDATMKDAVENFRVNGLRTTRRRTNVPRAA